MDVVVVVVGENVDDVEVKTVAAAHDVQYLLKQEAKLVADAIDGAVAIVTDDGDLT